MEESRNYVNLNMSFPVTRFIYYKINFHENVILVKLQSTKT